MGNRARTLALLAILAAAIAGCFPGGRGWKCDSDRECDPGLVCKKFGHVFEDNVCVSPGTTSIRSNDAYGWIGLVLFWGGTGVAGLTALVFGGLILVESLRNRRR